MHVVTLLIGLVCTSAGIVLIVVGRRRRLDRAATTGSARSSAVEIAGVALAGSGLLSVSRAFSG